MTSSFTSSRDASVSDDDFEHDVAEEIPEEQRRRMMRMPSKLKEWLDKKNTNINKVLFTEIKRISC